MRRFGHGDCGRVCRKLSPAAPCTSAMRSAIGRAEDWCERLAPSVSGWLRLVIASAAKQSRAAKKGWIASSRSLSSGARSRDPLAPRNDERSARRHHVSIDPAARDRRFPDAIAVVAGDHTIGLPDASMPLTTQTCPRRAVPSPRWRRLAVPTHDDRKLANERARSEPVPR